jgi:hypothetical protein
MTHCQKSNWIGTPTSFLQGKACEQSLLLLRASVASQARNDGEGRTGRNEKQWVMTHCQIKKAVGNDVWADARVAGRKKHLRRFVFGSIRKQNGAGCMEE